MKDFLKQKNKGFTLVEVLVAISIFTLSVLAMLVVLSSGITDTTYVKQKIIATYLAQEGIEYVHNMRDNYMLFDSANGWGTFVDRFASAACLESPSTHFSSSQECGFNDALPQADSNALFACPTSEATLPTYPCKLYLDPNTDKYTVSLGGDSGFTRVIKVFQENADSVRVTSTVTWNQPSGKQTVSFSEYIFNWY